MDPGAGPRNPQTESVVSRTEIVFDFLVVSVAVESVLGCFWRATASWRAHAVADSANRRDCQAKLWWADVVLRLHARDHPNVAIRMASAIPKRTMGKALPVRDLMES
jgi:hypothetical protein